MTDDSSSPLMVTPIALIPLTGAAALESPVDELDELLPVLLALAPSPFETTVAPVAVGAALPVAVAVSLPTPLQNASCHAMPFSYRQPVMSSTVWSMARQYRPQSPA